ncbi:MAG: hypothetical protein JXP72_11130 [Coriobacteriia bacterium]|nr:hypothetical protein [Coriobacteriia bacterium]
MTGTFDIRLATPADEPDVRALVGSVAMPGDVAVRFAREPDYFLGTTTMGDPCDVLVARHLPDGALAGIACRAERRSFVSGEESALGYIGQIRIAGEFRGRWLVPRGARVMRELSPPGLLYFGVIARENPRAAGALVGARPPAGIRAVRVSGLTTCAIVLRKRPILRIPGVEVQPASATTLPEVVAFLRAEGLRRQFFPAYTLDDFTGGRVLRRLGVDDVLVARREGSIVGTMAVWDQSAYKQDIVEAYGPGLRRLRPLYDLVARALGAPPLTPPGAAIPLAFAACTCIEGDDPDVARALVSAAAAHARVLGKAYLMVGLADADPLLGVVRRFPHITYRSDLYALSFDEDPSARLDGRVPYIEIATL